MRPGFTQKQQAYLRDAHHRWNFKYGATRSGKTYLDFTLIPARIRALQGRPGQVVLIGYTRGTLKRNILDPLAEMYGPQLVSRMGQDGVCRLFGARVYCMGADSARSVDRLRGMSIKYAYGDEVAAWEEEVFGILKSRLDKPYSCFDGTCNPQGPTHWLYRFLMSDADIYAQQYSLWDNTFLDRSVQEALSREHTGVFFDRYILGKWAAAEGLIFPRLAKGQEAVFRPEGAEAYEKVSIGIDFGGYLSQTCLVAVGFAEGFRRMDVLCEKCLPVGRSLDAGQIARAYVDFFRQVEGRYGRVDHVFGDSASPTMISTLVSAAREAGLPWRIIGKCRKTPITQRPITIDRLLSGGRLRFSTECKTLYGALGRLVWDAKNPTAPEDKNEDNINDIYDAFCYAWTTFTERLDRR